jgi:hypothetical protein
MLARNSLLGGLGGLAGLGEDGFGVAAVGDVLHHPDHPFGFATAVAQGFGHAVDPDLGAVASPDAVLDAEGRPVLQVGVPGSADAVAVVGMHGDQDVFGEGLVGGDVVVDRGDRAGGEQAPVAERHLPHHALEHLQRHGQALLGAAHRLAGAHQIGDVVAHHHDPADLAVEGAPGGHLDPAVADLAVLLLHRHVVVAAGLALQRAAVQRLQRPAPGQDLVDAAADHLVFRQTGALGPARTDLQEAQVQVEDGEGDGGVPQESGHRRFRRRAGVERAVELGAQVAQLVLESLGLVHSGRRRPVPDAGKLNGIPLKIRV